MLRPLHLYWTTPTAEIDLGVVFSDTVPRAGELIGHSHPAAEPGVWRITEVYYQALVQAGSPTHRNHIEGRPSQPMTVTLFVEPTAGPFRL